MKNLKKKFGKFAISTEQIKKIKGGHNCSAYSCPRQYLYQPEPGSFEYECCGGHPA